MGIRLISVVKMVGCDTKERSHSFHRSGFISAIVLEWSWESPPSHFITYLEVLEAGEQKQWLWLSW